MGAVLLLSCGGGGGGAPAPTTLPQSLMSLRICPGSPPTPSPTPMPTKGCPKPTKTATPECNPPTAVATSGVPLVTLASPGDLLQMNAQGTFSSSKNGKKHYRDATSDLELSWGIGPSPVIRLAAPPDGQFIAVTPGCTCLTAMIGNVLSCPVAVQVGSPGVACLCPTPTPSPGATGTFEFCPGPTVTPSPTVTPKPGCS
ncbi:MAG TPA: hypothetical protein VFB15_05405 [Candidatus Binataceae bacterium]|nr:hypothetical protein [Candidatus Binataceae bacterium]